MLPGLFVISLVVVIGSYGLSLFHGRWRRLPPLPPGPWRKPIIGNLLDLPRPDEQDWQHWLRHKKLFGPISSLSVLGKTIIILNDAQLAVQLLEKRSAIYSLRPQQTFTEMSGWDAILGALRKPEAVRKTRKHLTREIGSNKSVSSFDPVQQAEVAHFLLRVLDAPYLLQQHIRKEAGGIILKIGYGYTIESHGNDPLVDLADKAMEDFSYALLPATWAVDFFPLLRHLPPWLPGAGFSKTAQGYKRRVKAFSDVPFAFVRQQMQSGCFVPSFLSNLLENDPVEPGSEDENILKWSAGSLYAGGADTTVSSLASFFLAMALFPEVQLKAQRELDTVIGSHQLPGFKDRENLPYINALVKEVLRWHPVVPMNVAHASSQDDICEGYLIPKGSSILANIWAFTHDEKVYRDPMTFKPERFLVTAENPHPERDPHLLIFGFGRRACPGRTLADANIFLSVAQSLAVFHISKPVRNGEKQDVPLKFLPGVISHPAPFELSITPRSEKHRDLIRSLEQRYPWEKSDAGVLGDVKL